MRSSVLTSLIDSFVESMTVSIDRESFLISEEAPIPIGNGLWNGSIYPWNLQVRIGRRRTISLHIDDPGRWRVVRNRQSSA
jgi:hypothetical protein